LIALFPIELPAAGERLGLRGVSIVGRVGGRLGGRLRRQAHTNDGNETDNDKTRENSA
jgi:hypothetical protein